MPRTDWLNLPNKITLARLAIATLLFALLSVELESGFGAWLFGSRQAVLNIGLVVFIICVSTDWLDGYLARRYGMVTVFGRIADPFVDKIVICGAFIYLVKISPSLVKPWIATVILAREFLVTGLRSYMESQGIDFSARAGGKLKMVLQSIAVPMVLFYEGNFIGQESTFASVVKWTALGFVIATLFITVISAIDYVRVAIRSHAQHAAPQEKPTTIASRETDDVT